MGLGSRELLLQLLAQAAEIEHTLMCSYLYAVFSLKRGGEQGVAAAQSKASERCRKTVLNVPVEAKVEHHGIRERVLALTDAACKQSCEALGRASASLCGPAR